MDVSALIAQFRLDTRDTVQTYLWSDAEICTYIDEAQKQFCRLTGGLADATSSECARVALTEAVNYADISPRVLKIRAAFTAAGAPLQILNFEDLEFSSTQGLQLFAPEAGTLRAFVVGMEPNKIFFTTLPAADETINLIVYRLPLEDIEDDGCDLEIDAQHHIPLLKWARHLAHMKPDAETYDRGRSDQYGKEFENYCEMARMEKGAREHKYRTMQFSW